MPIKFPTNFAHTVLSPPIFVTICNKHVAHGCLHLACCPLLKNEWYSICNDGSWTTIHYNGAFAQVENVAMEDIRKKLQMCNNGWSMIGRRWWVKGNSLSEMMANFVTF